MLNHPVTVFIDQPFLINSNFQIYKHTNLFSHYHVWSSSFYYSKNSMNEFISNDVYCTHSICSFLGRAVV